MPPPSGVWWAPSRLTWWIGVLFAIGSVCFFIGPFPGFEQAVGSAVDGIVFFVGSIFFTSAAALLWLQTINTDADGTRRARMHLVTLEPRRSAWWSSGVQLVGTVLFNIDTFHALQTGLDANAYDKLVWTPDAVGSACFLASGVLVYVEGSGGRLWTSDRTLDWKIDAINLLGCIAFGISAIAAYWVPSEGSIVDLSAANLFTALGGLCFLVGAVLLLPTSAPGRKAQPYVAGAGTA